MQYIQILLFLWSWLEGQNEQSVIIQKHEHDETSVRAEPSGLW